MSDEYSKENLNKILYEVIEPKFQKYCYDWLYDAKPDEKRGLFVMSKIIKYKGQKTFSNKLDKEKEEEDLSLEAAYKRYQKRAQSSSYRDFYGGNVDQKFKYNNILKHKPFEFVRNLTIDKLLRSNQKAISFLHYPMGSKGNL